jgi:hypothetical protein
LAVGSRKEIPDWSKVVAKTIARRVGLGGDNLPADVKVVQGLLNQVPPASGGPSSTLLITDLCTKATTDAIQKFQLHHFGWSLADGRVDPGGPTLKKLNEFEPVAPLPPLGEPTTTNFQIRLLEKAYQKWSGWSPGGKEEWNEPGRMPVYEVTNTDHNRTGLYMLQNFDLDIHHPIMFGRHRPILRAGMPSKFITPNPVGVDAFGDVKFNYLKVTLGAGLKERFDFFFPILDGETVNLHVRFEGFLSSDSPGTSTVANVELQLADTYA